MSKIAVSLKIDVTRIEKARLFKGAKGTYLDATVFIDPDNQDQYGHNGMITQDVTKEEREAGTKGPILGNCKVFWKDGGQQQGGAFQQTPESQQAKQQGCGGGVDDFDSDIPF
jgi:hypothetical protein